MAVLSTTPVAPRRVLTPTVAALIAFIPTGMVNVLLGPLLPALSARWAMNDAQAGRLFTVQFLSSTVGVLCSGFLVPRLGYRIVIVLGLVLMAFGVFTLPLGSMLMGTVSISCIGTGFGIAIPAANLLVAETNPTRKASALNLLNFAWSVGAVACPLLVLYFLRNQRIAAFLVILGLSILLVGILLAAAPLPRSAKIEALAALSTHSLATLLRTRAALALGVLFFVYVGTENGIGGWLATYAKRMADTTASNWVSTPSYFYAALLVGRLFVPALLERIAELQVARGGIAMALSGVALLMASQSVVSVRISACLIGLGLAAVYPITIALLSNIFAADANRLGSVMFALAGCGAACVPWLVGFLSTALLSLRLGLTVPLAGCAIMLLLYLRNWSAVSEHH
jgi:FHS family glucose/mannose:H+ symporter-like MFS transporter